METFLTISLNITKEICFESYFIIILWICLPVFHQKPTSFSMGNLNRNFNNILYYFLYINIKLTRSTSLISNNQLYINYQKIKRNYIKN